MKLFLTSFLFVSALYATSAEDPDHAKYADKYHKSQRAADVAIRNWEKHCKGNGWFLFQENGATEPHCVVPVPVPPTPPVPPIPEKKN